MHEWNLIVTLIPGPLHERQLMGALSNLGRFWFTPFKDVLVGKVEDRVVFLETLRTAQQTGARWMLNLARVIPVDRRFHFTPQTLSQQLKEAAASLLRPIPGRSFHVRLERRGLAGCVPTQQIEREVADYVFELAAAQGIELHGDFHDPDFVVAAETLEEEGGLGLIRRDIRTRYPFVRTH
jgi:tRNA(Ser,Leu) C12 N-acetylase TAN1